MPHRPNPFGHGDDNASDDDLGDDGTATSAGDGVDDGWRRHGRQRRLATITSETTVGDGADDSWQRHNDDLADLAMARRRRRPATADLATAPTTSTSPTIASR
ncbi:Os06g0329032 [Oryza sativa Japonica Group]|uniref:Os06g0329032 protein n=1 Tax=Oryza sativa subsp. japonica TaxID=39947 RepID=A0A0P0WWE4_ORYSJ|nr:Os06g0329032 [Oryza sativa Japonica Group]